jgi:hypothetical protein
MHMHVALLCSCIATESCSEWRIHVEGLMQSNIHTHTPVIYFAVQLHCNRVLQGVYLCECELTHTIIHIRRHMQKPVRCMVQLNCSRVLQRVARPSE